MQHDRPLAHRGAARMRSERQRPCREHSRNTPGQADSAIGRRTKKQRLCKPTPRTKRGQERKVRTCRRPSRRYAARKGNRQARCKQPKPHRQRMCNANTNNRQMDMKKAEKKTGVGRLKGGKPPSPKERARPQRMRRRSWIGRQL